MTSVERVNQVVRVIIGLTVGFAAAFLIGRLVFSDATSPISKGISADTSFPAVDYDPAAAADLVRSWQAWRMGTFITDGTWTRTLDSGRPSLSGPVHVVQDPPRRMTQRLGATVELFDDSVAACEPTTPDDVSVAPCVAGDTGMTYQQRVAVELTRVGGYVEGEKRVYDVGRGLLPDCYRAELKVAALGLPWGRWAEFCFDPNSGALISSRVRRQSAIDVEVDTVTSTVVTEADFLPR